MTRRPDGSLVTWMRVVFVAVAVLAGYTVVAPPALATHAGLNLHRHSETAQCGSNFPVAFDVLYGGEPESITVQFTSSDPAITYRFSNPYTTSQPENHFNDGVIFNSPGSRTLTVTDVNNSAITDSITVNVVPPAGGSCTGGGTTTTTTTAPPTTTTAPTTTTTMAPGPTTTVVPSTTTSSTTTTTLVPPPGGTTTTTVPCGFPPTTVPGTPSTTNTTAPCPTTTTLPGTTTTTFPEGPTTTVPRTTTTTPGTSTTMATTTTTAPTTTTTVPDGSEGGGMTFRSGMDGSEEALAGDPDGGGRARITVDPDGTVCYRVRVWSVGPIGGAHIHQAPRRVSGPIVVHLHSEVVTLPNGDQLVEDCTSASPEVARRIIANPAMFYVNVHDDQFPGGALRGQLDGSPAGPRPPAADRPRRSFLAAARTRPPS